MQSSSTPRTSVGLALLGALSAAVLSMSGCQGQPAGDSAPVASASPTSTIFSGQSLPAQVDKLDGTPYYTHSPKLASIAGLEGAPFLLIAPQDPSKALLVLEEGSRPEEVVTRPSQLSHFSGTTESLDSPELTKFVKDETGLDLQQEGGKITVLRVRSASSDENAASQAPAPAQATPSEGAGS